MVRIGLHCEMSLESDNIWFSVSGVFDAIERGLGEWIRSPGVAPFLVWSQRRPNSYSAIELISVNRGTVVSSPKQYISLTSDLLKVTDSLLREFETLHLSKNTAIYQELSLAQSTLKNHASSLKKLLSSPRSPRVRRGFLDFLGIFILGNFQ